MAKSIPAFRALFQSFASDDSFFSDQRRTVSLSITTAGTRDIVTGEKTGGTTTTYSATGFRRNVLENEFREVDNNDFVFVCDQQDLGYRPRIDDVATVDSVDYRVVSVRDQGSVVYILQLRA